MNIFRKIKASLRLTEAVRQADNAHSENGHRYYVMPTSGTSGELIIMDRNNFRKLKKKGYINRNTTVMNLEYECFYATPYNNGSGVFSAQDKAIKRKSYFNWIEAVYKLRKSKKAKKNG